MAMLPMAASGELGNQRKRDTCPYCGSDELYRQRPRGVIEHHIFGAFNFAPYWCAACDRRLYLRLGAPRGRP
jgi:hypothetical protein